MVDEMEKIIGRKICIVLSCLIGAVIAGGPGPGYRSSWGQTAASDDDNGEVDDAIYLDKGKNGEMYRQSMIRLIKRKLI